MNKKNEYYWPGDKRLEVTKKQPFHQVDELLAAEALKEIIALLDENILVRNISEDWDIMKFMKQGMRITNTLEKAMKALNNI